MLATKTTRRKMPARKGGRPSASQSERIGDHIVEVASELFLKQGYGATSIEAIAAAARISKRTFYARFKDKEALFGAVVHQLVASLRPQHDAKLFTGTSREAMLLNLAKVILEASLRPEALALHQIMIGEATRFPELAKVMDTHGARREAITRIGQLLQHTSPGQNLTRKDAEFAAEQFLDSVITTPQRRAIGLGSAMTRAEVDRWGRQAVALFLRGCDGL